MAPSIKFVDAKRSAFFAVTRQRVEAYFRANNLSKHANGAMWAKTIFCLGGFGLTYGLILSNQLGIWVMLGLAVVLGIFGALIGFNVSHDAIHGSFTASSRLNKLLSYSFYLVGANPYLWNISHNLVHHTYTNIPGHDEDIEVAPGLVRLSEDQQVNRIQQFQHLYTFGLYGLASLSWVLRKDFLKFFKRQIGQHETLHHPPIEYFNLFFYKAIYYGLFIVLPLLVLEITWWQYIIGFLAMHLAEGWVLGLVFQLAHVVEGTAFPAPNQQGNIEEAWAVHQMQTTANFAPGSWLADFLCGGLNRQIEHHLFPKVCHIHYRAISGIVKSTAREYNLPYIENATFFSAIGSHYRILKKLGREAYRTQALAKTLARRRSKLVTE